MKKHLLQKLSLSILLGLLGLINLNAQVPKGISYQAVVRNTSGEIIANHSVSFRISFLSGSVSGNAVYVEIHNPTTNQFGLVNLALGRGTEESGTFDNIYWTAGPYFTKIEVDVNGGNAYVEAGISEILSVPVALLAQDVVNKQTLSISGNELSLTGGGTVSLPTSQTGSSLYSSMTYEEWQNLTNPKNGQMVLITNREKEYGNLFYFLNGKWYQINPYEDNITFMADAGPDIFACTDTAQLQAILPTGFAGHWSLSLEYNQFPDYVLTPENPNSLVTRSGTYWWRLDGLDEEGYPISAYDDVTVTLSMQPEVNLASETYFIGDGWKLPYNFINSEHEKGKWKKLTGENGYFIGNKFYGQNGQIYQLSYSLDNDCGDPASDTTTLYYQDIGQDNWEETTVCGNKVELKAPALHFGATGNWTTYYSYSGVTFQNPDSNICEVIVNNSQQYTFIWTVNLNGILKTRYEEYQFWIDNAGPDKNISDGSTSAQLNASPSGGPWSIISGEGGSISDPNSSWTTLNGTPGSLYKLVWNSECGADTVMISFVENGSFSSKSNYSYDANGNRTLYQYSTWDGTQLVYVYKLDYAYDANGNRTLVQYSTWDGTQWVNNEKYELGYDTNGNQTLYQLSTWDGTQWQYSEKGEYTYDASGNRTLDQSSAWDGTQWIYYDKLDYTYDANGNQTLVQYSTWDGTQWVYSWKKDYTYDASGNHTLVQYSTWDGTQWVYVYKLDYAYDANGNRTLQQYSNWDGTQWIYYYKIDFTYDANGNQTLYQFSTWDGTQWVNLSKKDYAYDANGNQTLYQYSTWDGAQWILVDNYSSINTYNTQNLLEEVIRYGIYTNTPKAPKSGVIEQKTAVRQPKPEGFNMREHNEHLLPHQLPNEIEFPEENMFNPQH